MYFMTCGVAVFQSCKARLYFEKSAQRIGAHSLNALVKGKLNTSGGHGTDSCTRHSARSHCNNECECVTSRRSPHGATGRKSSCASAGEGSSQPQRLESEPRPTESDCKSHMVALAVAPHCTSVPLARQHRTRVVPLQK